jgi:cytoskeleton protein RodZ
MTEASSEDAIEEPAEEQTVSERLVEAREGLGLSQKDVADQLFLTSAFIRYLDEAQFEKIPKPAFIKGYMRSYARVVNLKGDEIVAHYERGLQKAEHKVEVRGVTEERIGSATITGPVLQTGIVGLVAIVLVIALVWIFSSGDEEPESAVIEPSEQSTDTDASAGLSARDSDRSARLAEADANSDSPLNELAAMTSAEATVAEVIDGAAPGVEATDADDGIASADAEASDLSAEAEQNAAPILASAPRGRDATDGPADQKDITVESTRSENYQYINVDAGGFEQLEFSFTDECWLEIEDGDGQAIYGDLNRSGDILTLYGVAPFKILLGRASGVSLKFNREDVDLSAYTTRDQTAKLDLGG